MALLILSELYLEPVGRHRDGSGGQIGEIVDMCQPIRMRPPVATPARPPS
jgi:hypothetical protein